MSIWVTASAVVMRRAPLSPVMMSSPLNSAHHPMRVAGVLVVNDGLPIVVEHIHVGEIFRRPARGIGEIPEEVGAHDVTARLGLRLPALLFHEFAADHDLVEIIELEG